VCFMSRPSHPQFYHSNNIWCSGRSILLSTLISNTLDRGLPVV
jgi:hypothetical protein